MVTIRLTVQIGTSVEHVNFYVVEKLTTSVILLCNIFDLHVEAIRSRGRIVDMDDGSTG